MPYKKYVLVIAIAALMISSCTMSYPGADATPIPTNPFAKPLATDPMQDLEQRATGTALAKTAAADGGPTATLTPEPPDDIETPSATNTPIGPTSAVPATNTPGIGGSGTGATPTLGVVTGRPASYTLQAGEFPYCIARRFNVNPDDLLALNGLYDGNIFMAGTTLRIPQSGAFPGDRALRAHPTTYTVTSSNETFYSIACLFGDVDPAAIAQANGLALGSPLTLGQAVKIP
ncbi:MAG: LysM peptidoglycan-binding domain-containing protein [Anaerolineaceae bacterium]|nr:MAG: LysM peptidoglycan-binding domain-containing protein [Anaerolineaceae bacterium]